METDSNQPARSVRNLTQTAFDEIRLLYATFGRNPFDGFSLLRDYSPTTQFLKAEYNRFERLKENPFGGPSKIIFLDVERITTESVLNPSCEVLIWLYRNRIKSILQRYQNDLRDELSRLTNDVRIPLLIEYRKSLEKLSIQLIDFDGRTADSFPELANDTTANWPKIYSDLNSYIPSVQSEIRTYQYEVSVWVKDAPDTSTPPAKTSSPKQSGFDIYIVEEHRAKLMPDLIGKYTNTSPQQLGYMLYALVSSKCLPPATLNGNQTALHRALKSTFGKIGTRQALSTAIARLDPNEISEEDKRNIAIHTLQINTFL